MLCEQNGHLSSRAYEQRDSEMDVGHVFRGRKRELLGENDFGGKRKRARREQEQGSYKIMEPSEYLRNDNTPKKMLNIISRTNKTTLNNETATDCKSYIGEEEKGAEGWS